MAQYQTIESACFDFGGGLDYAYVHLALIQYTAYRFKDMNTGELERYHEIWLVEFTTEHEDASFDRITKDKIISTFTNADIMMAYRQFHHRADQLQHEIDSYSGV
jgi:predicted transcriptional regulator